MPLCTRRSGVGWKSGACQREERRGRESEEWTEIAGHARQAWPLFSVGSPRGCVMVTVVRFPCSSTALSCSPRQASGGGPDSQSAQGESLDVVAAIRLQPIAFEVIQVATQRRRLGQTYIKTDTDTSTDTDTGTETEQELQTDRQTDIHTSPHILGRFGRLRLRG